MIVFSAVGLKIAKADDFIKLDLVNGPYLSSIEIGEDQFLGLNYGFRLYFLDNIGFGVDYGTCSHRYGPTQTHEPGGSMTEYKRKVTASYWDIVFQPNHLVGKTRIFGLIGSARMHYGIDVKYFSLASGNPPEDYDYDDSATINGLVIGGGAEFYFNDLFALGFQIKQRYLRANLTYGNNETGSYEEVTDLGGTEVSASLLVKVNLIK